MEYLQMGLPQLLQFLCIFFVLFDMCCALTIVSESGNGDVICDRRNQTDAGDLPMYCQNGGKCVLSGCSCEGGFYGTVCQHSVVNAVIVVIVCILPPASWTLVFCYGCKERRRKRRLREQRRQQQNGNITNRHDIFNAALYAEDLPPSYSEIAHDNPIALCGMDNALYQTSTEPPPPNYDDVLKKAIECGAILPRQATRYSQQLELNLLNYHTENEVEETPQPSSYENPNATCTNPPLTQEQEQSQHVETNSQTVSSATMSNSQTFHSSREGLIDDADETESDNNPPDQQCDQSDPAPSTLNEQNDTTNSASSSVIVTSTQPFCTSRQELIDDEEMDCDQNNHVGDRVRTLPNQLPTRERSGAYSNRRYSTGDDGPSRVVVINSDPLHAHSSQIDLLAADVSSWVD